MASTSLLPGAATSLVSKATRSAVSRPPPSRKIQVPWYSLRLVRTRLFLAAAAGVLTALGLTLFHEGTGWPGRVVIAWDAAAIVLLGLSWWTILHADGDDARCHAAIEDPGRATARVLIVLASTISLFTAVVVLRKASVLAPRAEALLVVLCLIAVVAAWALTHTTYTLRYAHLYYSDEGEAEGGLQFPGDEKAPPNYLDLAYFAFTVGMCFQVSDVTITSSRIRRVVLGHSLLSFAYNTAVLALALNLIASLLG